MESEHTTKLIIDSFINFVSEHELVDKDNIEMLIDETVGSYISNTIQQLYHDYENHKVWLDDEFASDFDIENFVEIIDAYLYGFSSLENNKIINWLISLKKEIDKLKNESKKETEIRVIEQSIIKEDGNLANKSEKFYPKLPDDQNNIIKDSNMDLLIEMFPQLKVKDISKIYKKLNCNYERAIDELLIIQNASINDNEDDEANQIKQDLNEQERLALKEKTVQRFGFVPVNENGTLVETKPPAPSQVWNNEKKLVRYYESKVVSTKGEKFFELKTEEDIEHEKAMKKTYCNLKPARKYRFH